MNYIVGRRKRPEKNKWWSWIPVVGIFLPEYPSNRMVMDIYHAMWCMMLILMVINATKA